jgi:hypothetical protein
VALCERMRVFSVWLQVLVKADAATRARCSGTTQLIRSSLKNTSEERSGREGSEREGAKMNGTCLMIRYAWRVHGGQQHHGGGEFRVHGVVHIRSLLKSESEWGGAREGDWRCWCAWCTERGDSAVPRGDK